MSNEQRTARERIEAVVMGLIANTSDEVRGLSAAKTADDVRDAALAIVIDAANAQVAILEILNDLNHGATAL
jgi:hypothetical protein